MDDAIELDALRRSIRDVLDKECGMEAIQRHVLSGQPFDASLWATVAELGWTALSIPAEHGGVGLGLDALALLYRELGRVLAPLPLLPTLLAAEAIVRGGNDAQQARWLPGIAAGAQRATLAAPASSPAVAARIDGNAVVLDGMTPLLLDGAAADLLLVLVMFDDAPRFIVIERDADGIVPVPFAVTDQTRTLASLSLLGHRVPLDRVLGERESDVTGGGSGIGEAAALIMAREGARVVVADILSQGGESTVAQIARAGGKAIFVQADVSNEDHVANLVSQAVRTWGRLDCAFNNAGFGNVPLPLAELEHGEWKRVLNVVLDGVFLCMKHEIAAMLKTGGGAIVNTSSNAAIRGTPTQGAYCAAKAGVLGVTRSAAMDYANQGIRVNAICPGLVLTPLIVKLKEEGNDWEARANIPMGRGAHPSEIGEVAAWLCSAGASYLTGQAISVDGGATLV